MFPSSRSREREREKGIKKKKQPRLNGVTGRILASIHTDRLGLDVFRIEWRALGSVVDRIEFQGGRFAPPAESRQSGRNLFHGRGRWKEKNAGEHVTLWSFFWSATALFLLWRSTESVSLSPPFSILFFVSLFRFFSSSFFLFFCFSFNRERKAKVSEAKFRVCCVDRR